MWRIAPVAAIWLTFTFCQAAGGDMQSPRITRAEVDWEAAANAVMIERNVFMDKYLVRVRLAATPQAQFFA